MAAENEQSKGPFYVGVDVGTGSARACIIDSTGHIMAIAHSPIKREELIKDHITQSSNEIWEKICYCVKTVIEESKVDNLSVKGIGFDATCSLVVVDEKKHEPVAVGPNFDDQEQNIMLWMDHRAKKQTELINETGDKCLKYVGGKMSIEMEIPKIKWLKDNCSKETFKKCKFYDLSDFLTFKATGKQNKSLCAAACKQGFLPYGVEGSTKGWSASFLNNIGLEELVENDFDKLGGPLDGSSNDINSRYHSAGAPIGELSEQACKDFGLSKNCIVGSGIIDAYAGWVGTVAASSDIDNRETEDVNHAVGRLAVVAGTSSCHIAISREPHFVNGIWGPYKDILFENFWCSEGGQTCTGELLAYVLKVHPAYEQLQSIADKTASSVYDTLNSILDDMVTTQEKRSVVALGKHLFYYGDLRGNRSPLGDAEMRGSVIGFSMDTTLNDIALKYYAACEFIAQQTRHIIETMIKAGHRIKALYMSGGQCRNNLLMELLTNATGYPVVIPEYIDSAVVFGAALLGASASKSFELKKAQSHEVTLWNIMKYMTKSDRVIMPQCVGSSDRKLLDVKYQIYLDMAQKQKEYRSMVDSVKTE